MQDVTYDKFIEDFPEFTDISPSGVKFELALANKLQSQAAWGEWWIFAVELYTAHAVYLRYGLSEEAAEAQGISPDGAYSGMGKRVSASTTGLAEDRLYSALVESDNPWIIDLMRTKYGLRYLALMYVIISPAEIVLSPSAALVIRGGRR